MSPMPTPTALAPSLLPDDFVLLRRPAGHGLLELLTGPVSEPRDLDAVPTPDDGGPSPVFLLVPFHVASERGMDVQPDGTPLLAMRVHDHRPVTLSEVGGLDAATMRAVADGRYDVSDAEYEQIVRRVVSEEIGRGAGANFVISRSFVADLPGYSAATALAVFRHLLDHERGAYWTFLARLGGRTLIGATPERHLTLADGVATMNPISGTHRYPPGGPTVEGLVGFLTDDKESDELFMVLDEELKMMSSVCDSDVRVVGPELRMMSHLAHTEYLISGRTRQRPTRLLRETLFAPTVVGSPLVNAFRVISRHERRGRGYYSGVAALISRDEDGTDRLDSAILIRTAEIRADGRLRLTAGSTVVRHSNPAEEALETRAKCGGLLAAMGVGGPAEADTANHPEVRRILDDRNGLLNRFWFDPDPDPDPVPVPVPVPSAAGRTAVGRTAAPRRPHVLIVDAEDGFTSMLAHHVRSLGYTVRTRSVTDDIALDDADCVLLGPGPGDPSDLGDPRIARLHGLVRELLADTVPFLAVCLSHQVLSSQLGLPMLRRDRPHQGVQREITLFGEREHVGSYNTFYAISDTDTLEETAHRPSVEVSRDPSTGEVYALRSKRFSSVQFHLESVLTRDGRRIADRLLGDLCGRARHSG